MAKLTRRGFLGYTSVGVATVGVLAGVTVGVSRSAAHAAPTTDLSTAAPSGLIVTYVRDINTGEFGTLVGEREIIHRDRDLMSRILQNAK